MVSNIYIRLAFVLTLFSCTTVSFSQDEEEKRGILVEHAEKGKSHLIIEGYRVKVFTKDSNEYLGILSLKDKRTILVGKDEIKVADITEFRGNDKRRTTGGRVTMLVGGGFLGASVIAFIASGEITELTPLTIGIFVSAGVGIVTTSIGAALYGDKRNYKKSKGWAISIQGIEPE